MHSTFQRRTHPAGLLAKLPELEKRASKLLGAPGSGGGGSCVGSGGGVHRPQPPPKAAAPAAGEILLAIPVPSEDRARATRASLERRLSRERLRASIAQFSPVEVLRECLAVFARHPDKYGPLFRLLQEEHRRFVQVQLQSDVRVADAEGSLWGAITSAHSEYQQEKRRQLQTRQLLAKLDTLREECDGEHNRAAEAAAALEQAQEEKTELEQQLSELTVHSQELEREMGRLRVDMDKTQGKNIQLQTVFDAYAEADERQAARHMELLKKVDELNEANNELHRDIVAARKEHAGCPALLEEAKQRADKLAKRIAEQDLMYRTLQAEQRNAQLESCGSVRPPSVAASEGGDDREMLQDFFIGKGTSLSVPAYLRWHGQVHNLRLKKGEVERIIGDIWMSKSKYSLEKGPVSLSEYFATYLAHRYRDGYKRAEFAYSLIYGAERYKADSDCELFLAVLRYEVPEDVYFDQLQMLSDLKNHFVTEDKNLNEKVTGQLPLAMIKASFNKVIQALSSWRYQALCQALKRTVPQANGSTPVAYADLYISDRDGDQTPFMEELRDGQLHSIQMYIADICEEVHQGTVDECVTWRTVRDAWQRLDPSVDDALMQKRLVAIAKAIKYPPPDETNGDLLIAFADFKSAFEVVFVKRIGPDPTGGDMKWAPRTTGAPDGDVDDDRPASRSFGGSCNLSFSFASGSVRE